MALRAGNWVEENPLGKNGDLPPHPRPTALPLFGVATFVVVLAASASAGTKHVIAKLGQTLRDVGIHSRMSPNARVFYQSKQYEYLAVNPTKSSQWLSVVLQNGGKGYVPADSVAVLPYNVMREAPTHTAAMAGAEQWAKTYAPPSSATDGGVANYALNFVGSTPYKWGGTTIGAGIDCSGFVQKMFGTIGVMKSAARTASRAGDGGSTHYSICKTWKKATGSTFGKASAAKSATPASTWASSKAGRISCIPPQARAALQQAC